MGRASRTFSADRCACRFEAGSDNRMRVRRVGRRRWQRDRIVPLQPETLAFEIETLARDAQGFRGGVDFAPVVS